MKITIDFKGGPYDGRMTGAYAPSSIDKPLASNEEFIVVSAYLQTEGRVGEEFLLPHFVPLDRRIVLRKADADCDAFVYKITNKLDGNAGLLLAAEYLGLHPYQ